MSKSNIPVTCVYCQWMGTLSDCLFGHDDYYCPTCGKEGGLTEVMSMNRLEETAQQQQTSCDNLLFQMGQLETALRDMANTSKLMFKRIKDAIK